MGNKKLIGKLQGIVWQFKTSMVQAASYRGLSILFSLVCALVVHNYMEDYKICSISYPLFLRRLLRNAENY